MDNIFRGLGVALVTPFLENGEIDYPALENIVEYQISGGIDFLCVLGSTAETPCLTSEEKVAVKNFVVNKVNGRIPILLGFGGNSTRGLIEEIRSFEFKGVDGLLSVCPFYNKPSQEGLYQHFKAVAGATELPIVLYNVPGRTGINMEAATTLRLANTVENIVAIKEASGKIGQIDEIIRNCPDHFDVISGDDAITYELISIGAKGVISVIGNALPKQFGEVAHQALAGNFEKALPMHQRLSEVFKLLSVDGNPTGIKALLANLGLCNNVLRLPLVSARVETTEALKHECVGLV